ncbi:MAG: phosphoenolpyruvate carboxykinase (ATP) [Candidatus Zixiibacteriota bacterium]
MKSDSKNCKTPAQDQAEVLKSSCGLDFNGFTGLNREYWNLSVEALTEEVIFRCEGNLAYMGPVVVNTGQHTARAAQDKFIVKNPASEKNIWWGDYNRPFDPAKFDQIQKKLQLHVKGRDLFVQDCYGGADPKYRLKVRVITEYAWHSLFAKSLFISPASREELKDFEPEFTVVSIPSFQADPEIDGTRTQTFIIPNFEKKICLIGNTGYGGEIKKTIFTVLNYHLPLKGVLSMHCSANVGPKGDSALFFGLSGTGKTTLSADPKRRLIGDDEHGWSDNGVFNFEGGCYAKVINLSAEAEPQIYACTQRFGTILENVVFDPITRKLDLTDKSITENTRGAYPLDYIDNAQPEKMAGHPKNIILLTCDASGVMPPIAKLSPEQAVYHFISGYTSKVGGTEIGLGAEPKVTFSTCFGAPFMVHQPSKYAEMLRQKIAKHKVNCWLVNTGWTGGPFGVGKRMSIQHTRTLLNLALDGELLNVEYATDPVFRFQVPQSADGVPKSVLNPAESWKDKGDYNRRYRNLAEMFSKNFEKYKDGCPKEIVEAGPVLN